MVTAPATEAAPNAFAGATLLERILARISSGFVIALHGISPPRLVELVEGLRPRRLIALAELVERRRAGKSNAGLFAITVDDGVGENVRAITTMCRAKAWPVTFYLPTGYLDSGEPMSFQYWWSVKPHLPGRKLRLQSGTVDFSVPGAFKTFCKTIERAWYVRRAETYLPVTMELAKIVCAETGVDLNAFAPVRWHEVEALSRDPLFQFESHGVSHVAMSALREEEIAAEMQHSRSVIEDHTNRPCRHLCYPFGSPESIGPVAPKLARRFYDSAVTMSLNSADRGDLWQMGRIPLYQENSLLRARMKVLLRCTAWGGPRSRPPHA